MTGNRFRRTFQGARGGRADRTPRGRSSGRFLAILGAFLLVVPAAALASAAEPDTPPSSRGTTEVIAEPLSPVSEAIDDTARTISGPAESFPAGARDAFGFTTDPGWSVLQRLSVFARIKAGQHYAVQYDQSLLSLIEIAPADTLTTKARQAVNRAPKWLQKELEDQFSRMASTTQQDKWADEVLGAVAPYIDETAFLVAHMSKDDLQSGAFNAQLIRDSAHYAYEVDPYLDYVEVVDYDPEPAGTDYYTTLRYSVELDGTVTTVEYPREFYYWWVISPRESDETPLYIDPTVCSSGGTPAAPPTGKFWREWFFHGATNEAGGLCDIHWDGTRSEPCPVLKDMLSGVPVLWAHHANTSGATNGAVGMVNEWVRQSLGTFGDKDGCRPVQPVDIYYHLDGNCGEWADLTIAAGRAALIPTEETGTQVNDHVWNEFYDQQWGRWVQWEPVNNMIDSNYSGWWGGKIAATHTYRADGYGHSERTSQHGPSATLTVTVYDANHYPVDGAKVELGSEYDPVPAYIMKATQGHTDAQGEITFTLGDSRNYYVIVTTPWGSSGSWARVVTNAVADTAYAWSPPNFSGAVPRLSVTQASPSGTLDDNLLEADFTVAEGLVHGDSLVGSAVNYTKDHPGNVDFFVADSRNFSKFEGGRAFEAYDVSIDDPGHVSSFVPGVTGDFYATWSNHASMDMAQLVTGWVTLYCNNGAVAKVSALRIDRDAAFASLLDWEDPVSQNADGYDVYRSTSAQDVAEARTDAELQPFLLAHVLVSQYTDASVPSQGACFYYTVRIHNKRGGVSSCP